MRFALSIVALFAVAVALALLAGNNQGTITLYWPPYRVDFSLNLVLVLLLAAFVTLHLALKGLAALFAIPQEARRWRLQHKERAMHGAVLEAFTHLIAGRFIRSRKSAESALAHEEVVTRGHDPLPYAARLRAVAHWMVAESAHALHNRELRDVHLERALAQTERRDAQETREGLQLRAAKWALDDHDAVAALRWLDDLPQGAARRTAALRLELKAARLAQRTARALDTARLLAKHGAFSVETGQVIVRGLLFELIDQSHDPAQLQKNWLLLDAGSRASAEVAVHAARQLLQLGGDVALSRQWVLPAWERLVEAPARMPMPTKMKLIACLERGFFKSQGVAGGGDMQGALQSPSNSPVHLHGGALDAQWLAKIESAHMRNPGDSALQYLAGIACMSLQLWGKAQALLTTALPQLRGTELERGAWVALAKLAEQRGDAAAAQAAYRNAVNQA